MEWHRPRWSRWFQRGNGLAVLVAIMVVVNVVRGSRAWAENHVDYKHETYAEEKGRVEIRTQAALFETDIAAWLTLKGEFVYDGISGATPTGAPAPVGSRQVPLTELTDIRRAGFVEPTFRWGRHTFSPQVAYSVESDYESLGVSWSHSIDLNQKNTTLNYGVGQNFDTIQPKFWDTERSKDSTDFVLGVTQLLGPRTTVSLTLTLGTSAGYLSDPYKGVRFDGYPDPETVFPERRPGHRTKQTVLASMTQYVTPLSGSAEVSYRFGHDSYGIFSHTGGATWNQKLGKYVVVSPLVRYYWQTQASFYHIRLEGDPSDPESFPDVVTPEHYSADYRLSTLQSLTYGVGLTVRLRSWLSFDLAYKRYEMSRLDSVTAASNFPSANIYTVGLRAWF